MSFASILQQIVDGSPGGLGAALMGFDGIPIDQVTASGAADSVGDEVGVLGVELGRILEEMRKAVDSVEGGLLEEVTVRMSRSCVVLRTVDAETFLVVLLAPDANIGKARFMARRYLPAIREEL